MEKLKAERAKRTVYLPSDVNAWLSQQARSRGVSVSEWLSRAVDEVRGARILSDGVAARLRQGGD